MKLTWIRVLSLVLIGVSIHYLTQIIVFDTVIVHLVQEHGLAYWCMYYFPKILPILIMGLYCFADFQIGIVNRILKASAWIAIGIAVGLLTVFVVGLASGLSLNVFFGDAYGWSYEAPIEWTACFMACWILIKAKFDDVLLASTYGVLAVSAGGDLHEAVFGLTNIDHYYHSTYPLLLSTQILSMIFIMILAKKHHWKINKWFSATLVMYVVFTVLYATVFNPNSLDTLHFGDMWIQRIPTILLLTAIPTGFKYAEPQAD